jgi:cytochrome P450
LIKRLTRSQGLSFETLQANAGLLVIAGSETTATLLCGAVFLLASNPEPLAKVASEVRSRFSDESEITLTSVNSLSYMLACLNEAFRLYPPVAITAPRVTPEGGAIIAGRAVPGNVSNVRFDLRKRTSFIGFHGGE